MEESQSLSDSANYALEEIERKRAGLKNNKENGPDGNANQPSSVKATDLTFIMDLSLKLSVVFGKAKMRVNDLLQLGQGSVIELDKEVGEPLEIYINDKLLALGEVVVINEKFGIKLLNIVSPEERVKKLK